MVLYKDLKKKKYQERPKRVMELHLEEKPEWPFWDITKRKNRYRFITKIKVLVRRLPEYREYVTFCKKHLEMDGCDVFRNLNSDPDSRKRYSIELHHTPLTLFSIIATVVNKREALGESMDMWDIAEEVMELHYDGKVGLINLSKTAHELAENGKIFIPLQRIRHAGYVDFINEYEEYMDDDLKKELEMIIQMSRNAKDVVSDVLDTEFVYIDDGNGMKLPYVPDEWKDALKGVNLEENLKESEDE